MKFEECPRRNVSSFNLEILRDLSSPLRNSFVIFFGFPISSFPSFIILLKFRQCRFGSIRIFVFLAHLPPWFPEESKVISRLERGQDSIRRGLRTSWSITTNEWIFIHEDGYIGKDRVFWISDKRSFKFNAKRKDLEDVTSFRRYAGY